VTTWPGGEPNVRALPMTPAERTYALAVGLARRWSAPLRVRRHESPAFALQVVREMSKRRPR
jgi:hypothetical protein